jgi:hypothetical protein
MVGIGVTARNAKRKPHPVVDFGQKADQILETAAKPIVYKRARLESWS